MPDYSGPGHWPVGDPRPSLLDGEIPHPDEERDRHDDKNPERDAFRQCHDNPLEGRHAKHIQGDFGEEEDQIQYCHGQYQFRRHDEPPVQCD
jgi:hypothetical protein